jgi:hypothetical protein
MLNSGSSAASTSIDVMSIPLPAKGILEVSYWFIEVRNRSVSAAKVPPSMGASATRTIVLVRPKIVQEKR